jgi:SagB-type dehydrogenase family enzyme
MPARWLTQADTETNRALMEAPNELLFVPSEVFHENSMLRPSDTELYARINYVNTSSEVRATISRPFTHYHGAPTIALPREFAPSGRSFEEVLQSRRSVRDFSGAPMSLETLAKILLLGDGIVYEWQTDDGSTWGLRPAPSPGGLYPVEMYCLVLRVEGLTPGVYFYHAKDHALELVSEQDPTDILTEAVPAQAESIRQAAVCVALSAVMARVKFKYGERGYRFLLLEAGHISQNLLLAAEAENLGGVAIGGFLDEPLNTFLELNGVDEAVLYLTLLGDKANPS